ncbi:MAG: S53 family peptidase, partial [Thermoplasmata archaeon]
SYYSELGFKVVNKTPFMVELSGNVSLANAAFNANMYQLVNRNGEYLYSNINDISIPSSIAKYVASVDGLSNVQMTSNPVYPTLFGKAASDSSGSYLPAADQNYINHTDVVSLYAKKYVWADLPITNGPYPGSAVIENTSPFQALFPSDLPWIYNAAEGFNGTSTAPGANGTGVTIAIVMGTGYYNNTTAYPAWNWNDMYKYGKEVFGNPYQILDRVTYLNASGMTHKAPPNPSNKSYVPFTDGYLGEFTLDTQYSATMAPDAHLDIMAIPSLSTVALDNAYSTLLELKKAPQIITNSWSGSEDTWWSLYGPSWQSGNFMNEMFMLLDARGSTIVAASGDSGGYDGYTNSISGEFPGTSPWVTGIGGNQVTMFNSTGVEFPVTGNYTDFNVTFGTANYSSAPPYYWPNLTMNVVNIGLKHDNGFTQQYWDNNQYAIVNGSPEVTQTSSGSAALSIFFTQPYWQHGYLVPNTGRMSEVQLSAEAGFNQTELIDGDWGSWFFGGTSEATPTTAGMLADVLSYLNATATIKPVYLGDINPLIYEMGNEYMQNPSKMPNPYFFVTNGSNSLSGYMVNESYTLDGLQNYPPTYWTTDNGYSMLTGWGSINVNNFKMDIKKILTQPFNLTGNITGNTTVSDGITMSMPSGLYDQTNYTFNVSGSSTSIINAPRDVNLSFMPSGSSVLVQLNNSTRPGLYNYSYSGGKLKIYSSTFDQIGFLQLNGTYKGTFAYSDAWIADRPIANRSDSSKLGKNLSSSVEYGCLMGGFPALFTQENTVPINSTDAYFDTMEPPMEPNMQQINVNYDGKPVYNALVVLSYNGSLNVNITNEVKLVSYLKNNTVSYGITNLNGQALVDTWNVYHDTRIFVYTFYSGMMNKTSFMLTPQSSMIPVNTFENHLGSSYENLSYLRVWQGENLALQTSQNSSMIALYQPGGLNFYGPSSHTEMIPGTAALTNATGYVDFHISNSLPEGLYYIGIQNDSAQEVREVSGTQIDGNITYMPIRIAG